MNRISNKGFTLLEMILAIAIITIGALGVFGSAARYSKLTQKERENLVAAYLCQEGIETVKNIRDTNWIESAASWKDGLTSCSAGCQGDFEDNQTLSAFSATDFLYIDGATGLYQYIASPDSNDTKTSYTRKITIVESGSDELQITVDVYWGGNTMTVKENIYDWKN